MIFSGCFLILFFAQLFPVDVQPQLVKYLLKTLCTDITNELAVYVAHESKLNVSDTALTVEQRIKIAQECGKFRISYGVFHVNWKKGFLKLGRS
jgi:hypothetical protein